MIRILAITIALSLLGFAAHAAPIRVRSGEHADFTRFVFYLPQGTEAAINELSDRLRIESPDADGFDFDGLFDRIPRDRVLRAERGPGGALDLLLACNCGYQTSRGSGGMLVLDVLDPPVGTKPTARTFRWSFSVAGPRSSADNALAFPLQETGSEAHIASAAELQDPQDLRSKGDILDEALTGALDRQSRVREAEARLARQLARATTQGLLDQAPSPTAPGAPQKAVSAPRTDIDPQEAPPNVDATTSIDRAARQETLSAPVDSGGEVCPDDKAFDLMQWRGPGSFGVELGRHRARLYNDLDVTDTDAREGLARFYLGYGFGTEARQVLSGLPIERPAVRALTSMSQIFIAGHEPPPGAFHSMSDCASNAALWAVLSYEVIPPRLPLKRQALLRGFDALPSDIRQHLGPDLAARLLEFGDPDLAASVLQLVRRGQAETGPATDLAAAQLSVRQGNAAEANETLGALVETNTPPSPTALAMLIETRVANGERIDKDLVALAEAYATELRHTPEGPTAERAAILGVAAAGRYSEAMDRLGPQNEGRTDWAETRSRIAALLASDAPDARFLALAARLADESPDTLAPGPANAVANRLHSLGFGDLALAILSGPANGDLNRERRMIRARIAVDSRRPRRAEAEVVGLEGPDADRVRAEAAALRGNHAEAARYFEALNDAERAVSEAWRAGDWALVQAAGDGALSAAAALAGTSFEAEPFVTDRPDQEGALARNRALLERAGGSRETLDRLLREVGSGASG